MSIRRGVALDTIWPDRCAPGPGCRQRGLVLAAVPVLLCYGAMLAALAELAVQATEKRARRAAGEQRTRTARELHGAASRAVVPPRNGGRY